MAECCHGAVQQALSVTLAARRPFSEPRCPGRGNGLFLYSPGAPHHTPLPSSVSASQSLHGSLATGRSTRLPPLPAGTASAPHTPHKNVNTDTFSPASISAGAWISHPMIDYLAPVLRVTAAWRVNLFYEYEMCRVRDGGSCLPPAMSPGFIFFPRRSFCRTS